MGIPVENTSVLKDSFPNADRANSNLITARTLCQKKITRKLKNGKIKVGRGRKGHISSTDENIQKS